MFICDESMQTHTITSIPEPENDFLKQTALHSLEKTPFHLHSNFLDRFYECCGRSGKWIFGFYFQMQSKAQTPFRPMNTPLHFQRQFPKTSFKNVARISRKSSVKRIIIQLNTRKREQNSTMEICGMSQAGFLISEEVCLTK